jgi:hypothetical protein
VKQTRAPRLPILGPDAPAVCFDQTAHDRKPEASALRRPGTVPGQNRSKMRVRASPSAVTRVLDRDRFGRRLLHVHLDWIDEVECELGGSNREKP